MRLLIFLLALSSAFFVSNAYSFELDMDNLKSPQIKIETLYQCTLDNNSHTFTKEESLNACYENNIEKITDIYPSQGSCSTDVTIQTQQVGFFKLHILYQLERENSDGDKVCDNRAVTALLRASNPEQSETMECPPSTFPRYKYDVYVDGQLKCAKEKNNCPTPTNNDPFVFGTGIQSDKCFKNPDGSQCKIQTDENGGYYIPVSYGSAEPVQCARAPDKEVDKTSPPEEKPAPEDTDDGAEMNELDALNKINDNLDAMNENQVAASDSNDDRLDRVSEEIQIGNEILGEIRYNTDLIESNTDDTNDLLGETNGLLADILDNTGGPPDGGGEEPCTGEDCEEPDTFTITAERKNAEKGLNSIFTDDQRQVITDEIDEKKQEIEDYFEQIESESSSLFDINPSLGGGYEERIEVIKGVEVDMGLGRLASFFQLIAAAVMLCSTLTALYILLGP